ncbi:hypothetical protein BEH_26675 (plasmid) [Priestia filamentosa]|uniref:DUF3967 domain-containing protein n=1 Tax=Priestia filamentosa TaxID=1402861 RepID=A0A2S1LZY4_9BACI|nr:DUF3967 domain-containing protein [Priestia filamentosa]AWG44366.1 hypothetical protein BEH_26675 [Priestia filamentosa]
MLEEKAYWNNEVAKMLEIPDSTLRKWCIQLESNGYTFIKGEKDSRAFTMHDLTALKVFKQLVKVERKTKETASKEVVKRYGERDRTPPVQVGEESFTISHIEEKIEGMTKILEELKLELNKQTEFNKQLVERMDQQSINYIRELQETKKQIAVSKEKKNWWVIFKKIFKPK